MRQILYTTIIATLLFATGCSAPQRTVYFSKNIPVDVNVAVQKMDRIKDLTIQSEDILAIHVSTISSIAEKTSTATSLFNDGGTGYSTSATPGSTAQANGYLVDDAGYVDFPVLGKVKVAGLTLRQIKEMLALKLKDYVKDPVVEARIINYKVTVLGEISHPGSITAPNHKISVIDAIAAAGDIPITGRKDNVLVIRENEGTREFARLDLNSKNVFNSPYYYLKQNDIVYIEPSTIRKQENNNFVRVYLPIITSIITLGLTVYAISLTVK